MIKEEQSPLLKRANHLFKEQIALVFEKVKRAIYTHIAIVALLKRATGANCSCHYLLKERLERFAIVAFYLKSDESYLLPSLFL